MDTTIKCKKCGEVIEISEAIQHQIKERILASEKSKHQKEIKEIKKQAQEEAIAQIEDLKNKQEQAVQKSKEDSDFQLENLQKENEEEKERNAKLLKESKDHHKEKRDFRRRDEERELEMQKKIAEEEEIIRDETKKKVLEEHELKDREKDKQLQNALAAFKDSENKMESMKNKMERGSQQLQGEVMEVALEETLQRAFSQDKISNVKAGQRGADVEQIVIDKWGRECGKILWESKNAQWNKSWLAKLREDQRQAKAEIAVLVATNLPSGVDTFKLTDKVCITKRNIVVPLATLFRDRLIAINNERNNSAGKDEAKETLYQYLTSVDFKHRVEAIVEGFTNLQEDLEKERNWFMRKWARQEKEIRKIVDNTQGMYGDLQSATGRTLSPIKVLELPDGDNE